MKNRHSIIVGGGVVGLAIAWELSRRGDQVTLFERNSSFDQGTSWSAAGILPPADFEAATDPIDQLRGLSHQLYADWTDELSSQSGIDTGFRRCGGLYLAHTAGERASLVGMTQYWNDLRIRCEPVSDRELRRREPALDASKIGRANAWFLPDECQVRPPHLVESLRATCQASGVRLATGAAVKDVRWTTDVAAVMVDNRWHEADRLVLCGGVWTGRISERLRLESSLIPIRGQMLLLKTPRPLLNSIVNVGHRYLICRDDGHTLIGSCEEEVGFQPGTTDAMLASLRAFAVDLVPELAEAATVRHWSGLRPLTFDGFPMIGRFPKTENVFVAAGHFRSGIHLAPATAVVLADLMTGKRPQVDLDCFRVGKQRTAFPLSP